MSAPMRPHHPDDDARRPWRPLLAITTLALILRLAVTLGFEPLPPLFSDAEYYDVAARSLANGDGYSVQLTDGAFLPGGSATAFFPPGYSFFLAVPYAIFGPGVDVARLANVLAGALTVPVVYLIGARLFSIRAGLLAAALAAVFPGLLFWTPVMLSETFFTFVFALAVLCSVTALRDGRLSWPQVALAGFVTGLAVLVRGQALILLPVAVLWWWISGIRPRDALLGGGLALAAAAVLLLPWSIRNFTVFDAPVLLSTNFGYNLRVGHAPYANGRFIDPADLYDLVDEGENFELVLNDEGARLALDYALANPGREAELSLQKVRWLWSPDSDVVLWLSSFGRTPLSGSTESAIAWTAQLSHWTFLLLLIPGLATLGLKQPGVVFAGLLCLAWTAVHVVFFGEPRYHLPLLPVLLPIAAAGLLAAWQRVSPAADQAAIAVRE
ncbi:MAG: phospholipid carrier-dependent glycosyltransferase [Dehalococcoidia bacterium]|nr:phospholipid carrier-dependent glycosyltransferase [Dehalococcoidia bacterium]